MKKICINCLHVKWLAEDLETKDITEDNDVLICTHPFNSTSAQRLEVTFYEVEENSTCVAFMSNKKRSQDIKDCCDV